jgi:hypothetical protein
MRAQKPHDSRCSANGFFQTWRGMLPRGIALVVDGREAYACRAAIAALSTRA